MGHSCCHWLRSAALALQFYTRIPLPGRWAAWVGFSPALLRDSVAHLPAVGALIGCCTAACFAAVCWSLPSSSSTAWIAAWLSTALGIGLTGAFHEDGLADLSDGLGGSYQRERALEIMKDSRLGSFGAIALVLALGLKVALLVALAEQDRTWPWLALLTAHTLSRLSPLLIMSTLPYIGEMATAKSAHVAHAMRPAVWGWAMFWSALVLVTAFAFGWSSGAAGGAGGAGGAVVTMLVVTLFMRWRLQVRLQGYTGDALGATQQVSELAFYLGWLLVQGSARYGT